ncbi:FAD-dependent oxidoreductase [Actinomycetospora sp.]|uniref:FAD-dependent oxidoreductase n=1 Tax=Actinomycetospora sp. TaxID=1872135 RepID=UPI002F412AD0
MDDVVVVGAGPTGLTAAIELARRGVRVRVLDAADGPHRGSRGKGMQPRTLELLDAMGVADRLVSLGRFELPIRRHDPDGSVQDVELNPAGVPDATTPWARSLIIPQWRTEQVLRERLGEEGLEVEYGRRVASLSQDESGVRIALEDGQELRAAWVVGADGGSSTVRRELGVGFLGETHEEIRLLLGDVELDGLDRDHWHMFSGAGAAYFALCPLPATSTWQVQIGHSDPEVHASEPVLREFVDALAPRIRVRRVVTSGDWRLNVRMADEYRVGRVLLAGDAAHVHSPAGGQGMNTGISDAINLGWKLAAVASGTAVESLLDTYSAERLPIAAGVLGLSSALTGRRFWQRTSEQVRDALGFGTSYRGGPLAASDDDDGPGPRPGDRAPNAPLVVDGAATDLFAQRRRADWTVLTFGGAEVTAPELPSTVQVLEADALAADAVLREAYGAGDGEVVVIRPDGYVWSRAYPAKATAPGSGGHTVPSAGGRFGSSR